MGAASSISSSEARRDRGSEARALLGPNWPAPMSDPAADPPPASSPRLVYLAIWAGISPDELRDWLRREIERRSPGGQPGTRTDTSRARRRAATARAFRLATRKSGN